MAWCKSCQHGHKFIKKDTWLKDSKGQNVKKEKIEACPCCGALKTYTPESKRPERKITPAGGYSDDKHYETKTEVITEPKRDGSEKKKKSKKKKGKSKKVTE